MNAGTNSSTFCGVLRCARTATCVNSSPCARGVIAARYLWSGNSHKATHFPVALVRQRPGHFNPSVLGINLMFLDSLAQSKRADGTVCPLWKAQYEAKGEAQRKRQSV